MKNYLHEKAFKQISEEITDIEESLTVLRETKYLANGPTVKFLLEKLDSLKKERESLLCFLLEMRNGD